MEELHRPASVEKFLDHLAERGLVSVEGAMRAGSAAATTGQPVDIVLTELGLINEEKLADEFAAYFGLNRVHGLDDQTAAALSASGFSIDPRLTMIPLALDPLVVAISNPFDRPALDALAFHLETQPELRIATRKTIETSVRSVSEGDDSLVPSDATLAEAVDLDRLRDFAREAPVVRFVARTIEDAVQRRATDIHIEPGDENIRIRIRIDGALVDTGTAPKSMQSGIITRLKILSQLNIGERRLPQDGRMRAAVRGQNVDLRVSIVPSSYGESIVLRILDRAQVRLDLDTLGFQADAQSQLESMVRSPNGILLVTGPTGSGKTTTLYSLLKKRVSRDVKIFTIEDPVEHSMAGITQLQVDAAIDLDFARALRSVLRQDPDIILVGEIRDPETAEIAVRAALTGHLVLSTLHTNSAAGAFTRLRDIGIDDYLLSATIRAVVGQRLVRLSCRTCNSLDPTCPTCNGSGFRGRIAAYEILAASRHVQDLVSGGSGEREIEDAAMQAGMVPLSAYAEALVERGLTTRVEVQRAVFLQAE